MSTFKTRLKGYRPFFQIINVPDGLILTLLGRPYYFLNKKYW